MAIEMKNLRNDRNQSDMDGAQISCNIDTGIVVPPVGLLLGVYHPGVCWFAMSVLGWYEHIGVV